MIKFESKRIKELAFSSGFDLCGITTPEIIPEAKENYQKWLAKNYHGEMEWLNRNVERRTNPSLLIENAKSVIMLGLNYYQPNADEIPKDYGRVSRYARGKDYHKIIKKKIENLIFKMMLAIEPGLDVNDKKLREKSRRYFRWFVDYGPFVERSYAAKAGLGFIGKNGMLINKQFGSWIFLAEIISSLEITIDDEVNVNHGRCGTCTKCIDACPTSAIIEDGILDATKCISYLTIEKPSDIPEELTPKMGKLIFGCDICQEVCPHNGRAIETTHKDFMSDKGVGEFLNAKTILKLQSREDFLKLTAGTPLVRPKLDNLQRNAKIVLGK
ncbi:MAG: tRNA epoxyqueuosine(34) reductase QueG [candidate division Zixibacteria bacterium]|nr:tRNA epoxyqueuosine(34) reductase QueG [candidate division Zixibacteria bacterium]